MKDYVLADELVFADSAETDIPSQEHFGKILNNSFCLTEAQFGTLASIATGAVDTSSDEISIPTPSYPDCFFIFQAGQRDKNAEAPPVRDYMIAAAVNLRTQKMHRIYIRAKQNSAEALEKLLKYYRPQHFFRDLMESMETGAQIVAVERQHRAPPRNKPYNRNNNQSRNDRPSRPYDGPHSTMGERWPGKGSRKPGGGKDRRHGVE